MKRLSYVEARSLLTGSGWGANDAQDIRRFDQQFGMTTRQQTFAEEQGRAATGLAGQRFGLETELGRGNLALSQSAQAFTQARDPFNATQKAANLRGPAPPPLTVQGAPEPPPARLAAVQPSPYEGMAPGLRSTFEGGTPGQARTPLAPLSGQARMRLLPSEKRILDAEILSRGIEPEDYDEISRRLTQTGQPSQQRRVIRRRQTQPSLY